MDPPLLKSPGGKLEVGRTSFKKTNAAYKLHKGKGSRAHTICVPFSSPFENSPSVVSMLSSFHIAVIEDVDLRICATDQAHSNSTFEIKLATWNDSKVYEADVSWIAFGDTDESMAGTYTLSNRFQLSHYFSSKSKKRNQ